MKQRNLATVGADLWETWAHSLFQHLGERFTYWRPKLDKETTLPAVVRECMTQALEVPEQLRDRLLRLAEQREAL